MRRILAAVAALAIAVAAGCGTEEHTGPQKLDLQIANLLPITGFLDQFGKPGRRASDTALEEIRKAAAKAGAQHTVTMWDAEARPLDLGPLAPNRVSEARRRLWAGGPVPAGTTSVSFSPGGKLLAATRDKTTGIYEATTGRPVLMNPPLPGGKAAAFSPASGPERYKLAITDGRKVEVRVNDRGPFKEGRIVDVSLAAAKKLGLVDKGLARVRLYRCEVPVSSIPAPFQAVMG